MTEKYTETYIDAVLFSSILNGEKTFLAQHSSTFQLEENTIVLLRELAFGYLTKASGRTLLIKIKYKEELEDYLIYSFDVLESENI
jgi:hypothetical protein